MSENIKEVNMLDQYVNDFTAYAIYLARRRVLPDPRDGLKPVHRKIIYTLFNDFHANNASNTVKTASVTGRVIERYHPHGETSVAEAIKPMINWFEIYEPLLCGTGSFGSMYGDPMSATRYTEVALSDYGYDCIIGELKDAKTSVDWQQTYDGKYKEPVYLPTTLPNLLINGAFGIAVGLITAVPKHNINEVIDATIHLLHHPNSKITLIPDNCSGSDIVDTDWDKISRTGKGSFKVRGRMEPCIYKGELYNNHPALKIVSMPDLVFFDTVKEQIEKIKDSVPQIIDILNKTEVKSREGNEEFEVYIILKKGADPNYIKSILYASTSMEATIKVNFEVIYNESPVLMNYTTYLNTFLEFRRKCKFRTYANKLQNTRTTQHKILLYVKAMESGEMGNIIKMIHKQKTIDDSVYINYLIEKLKVTPLQAKFLLDTDIRKLSIGYLNKYKQILNDCDNKVSKYYDMITNPELVDAEIEAELKEYKKKYGCPRRSSIISVSEANNIPEGIFKVVVTERGFIKKMGTNEHIGYLKDDKARLVLNMDNKDNLLIFSKLGKVFNLPVHKIPFSQKGINGTDIRQLIKKEIGSIAMMVPQSIIEKFGKNKNNKYYLYAITEQGLFKRMELDDFTNVPPSGIIYYKIDTGDFVKDIIFMNPINDILIYSNNKVLRINGEEAPLLNRSTKGNIAMSSKNIIDGFTCLYPSATDIVVVTEKGKVNRVSLNGVPLSNRAKAGSSIIKLSANDAIRKIMACNQLDFLIVTTQKQQYKIQISEIPIGSSISTGTKLIDSSGIINVRYEHVK
jgi:DNA gyrase subunit A